MIVGRNPPPQNPRTFKAAFQYYNTIQIVHDNLIALIFKSPKISKYEGQADKKQSKM